MNGVYRSKVDDMTLNDFIVARQEFCRSRHKEYCDCQKLIMVAADILQNGFLPLKDLFCKHFGCIPSKFKTEKAVSRMMQLPVAVVPLNINGGKKLFVCELISSLDYSKLQVFIDGLQNKDAKKDVIIEKDMLQMLCELASSEKDKRLIKYAVCTSSQLSSTSAKNLYGVSDLAVLQRQVAEALDEAQEIRDVVTKIASIEKSVALERIGLVTSDISSESNDNSSDEGESVDDLTDDGTCDNSEWFTGDIESANDSEKQSPKGNRHIDPDVFTKNASTTCNPIPSHGHLLLILRENRLNWISLVRELQDLLKAYSEEVINQALIDFSYWLSTSANDVTTEEEKLIEQSRQAYLLLERERAAQEDIQSDSDSDDPEQWTNLRAHDLRSEKMKEVIDQQRRIFKKRARRRYLKEVATKSLLKRKVPKRASKLLKKYPNLGKDIESFVHENRIGADAWRRTGVATFDGNIKSGRRVTYSRIKEHLEQKYGTKFSYGAVVQLSVARNKRRASAKRYWGAAQVTSRRARKAFNVRLNPDCHWSAAFYRGLDKIQLEDGRDKTVINRDDQSGFRLDTTYTHKQHKAVSGISDPEKTTRTDYVNKYASVLQTTSYMILPTNTTCQATAGIVKPHMVFPKNASQHTADLAMLENHEEFYDHIAQKKIDCIRVDGASDENPGHDEVQFLWTERHLEQKKVCTLVSTRCSGSSYLNRVELQNGCLAISHSNLFIPSTLHGSNFNPHDGGIDYEKLEKNLTTAADVYISKCNGAPCGESSIILIKGNKNDLAKKYQERRPHLLTFLKGSKKQKEELKTDQPTLYDYFCEIWALRNRHMVPGLPSQYVFQLLLCYEVDCIHPLCREGRPKEEETWFPGGPSLSYLPIPIPDVKSQNCEKCGQECRGHYLQPDEHIEHVHQNGYGDCQFKPPKSVIEEATKEKAKENATFTNEELLAMADNCCLPVTDVHMWVEHVNDIVSRRKARAAERSRKQATQRKGYLCSVLC